MNLKLLNESVSFKIDVGAKKKMEKVKIRQTQTSLNFMDEPGFNLLFDIESTDISRFLTIILFVSTFFSSSLVRVIGGGN